MNNLSEIQLDSEALLYNLEALSRLVPTGSQVAVVVKGNAYGHGLPEVVSALDPSVDAFQVDDLDELRLVRQFSKRRVLVLGYVPDSQVAEAVALGGELALYDQGRLLSLAAAGAKVHLKIDALLGRQGILPADVPYFVRSLPDTIDIVGAYGHFANIEDTTDLTHPQSQLDAFEPAFEAVRARYPRVARHFSATSGLMTMEATSPSDLIRIGIGAYGLYPSGSLSRVHAGLDLKPALRWVSHLAQVKLLPARHPVGYGLTYITRTPTLIGIVPQGYSDGYDRGFSNVGEVLVRGVRCPVIGRIAMNMFAVDLSSVPNAVAEEEVVLLGTQGDETITAEELAAQIGTINYEVTTRISPLLPRVVV